MQNFLLTFLLAIVLNVPGYIGPPVVVRLCQFWPGLCLPQ